MAYIEEEGDLFDLPESVSLAHCVAQDFHMGAGIAKMFLKKFGSKDILRSRNIGIGEVTYIVSSTGKPCRYIYYLVTKNTSWSKPTYKTIEQSIIALFASLRTHNIDIIGMPYIGCGLKYLK